MGLMDKYITNVACTNPECLSSDAVGVYERDNGEIYGNCFSCGTYHPNPYGDKVEEDSLEFEKVDTSSHFELKDSSINMLYSRGIPEEVCEKWGVRSIVDKDGVDLAHFYPHRTKDNKEVWCIRGVKGKKFKWIGSPKDVKFFGQDKVGSGGKMIIVTEGVCDKLAVDVMLGKCGKSYRSVSIVNGAQAAIKDFQNNYEWISTFEQIFLCFDQDEPGLESMKKVAEIFPPNKVKSITFDGAKDANELLLSGRHQDFLSAIFSAKETKPDGIVSVEDIFDEAIKPPVMGLSWPWDTLTEVTYGYRRGELYGVGAGSGCVDGDTEFLSEIGWKKIKDYTKGDLVAQYDHITKTATLVDPIGYIVQPAIDMYHIKTKYGIDMCLSDNHEVLYYTSDNVEKVDTLKSIREIHKSNITGFRGNIETSFISNIGNGISLSDSEIRVQVAVHADGNLSSKYKVRINLKKERKKIRLVDLLNSAGISYIRRDCDNGYSVFTFNPPIMSKTFGSEWYTCNSHQLSIIADEVLYWDGNQKDSFSTTIKKDADFIQYVFNSTNKRASICILDRLKDKGHVEYKVTVSTPTRVSFRKTLTSNPEFKKVLTDDGKMYCFEVPKGFLVLRRNGSIFITGNCGKTEFFKECIHHTINTHKLKAGVIFLEEPATKTLKVLAGKKVNKRFHIPSDKGGDWTVEELVDGINDLKGKVYLYNHFGAKDWDSIKGKIRFMVSALGIKDIYLDHLTALVAQEDNEYKALNKLMEEMSSLCQELDCTIFYVSHLRKAPGTPHEEGGRVTADQFKGSGAIVFWSNFLIGLERNQQAEDEEERNTTTLRVLKDRNTGLATGTTFQLVYNHTTGRWGERDEDEFNEQF